jgi:hypothetical protein
MPLHFPLFSGFMSGLSELLLERVVVDVLAAAALRRVPAGTPAERARRPSYGKTNLKLLELTGTTYISCPQ